MAYVDKAILNRRQCGLERAAFIEERLRALRAASDPAAVYEEYPFVGLTGRHRWRFDVATPMRFTNSLMRPFVVMGGALAETY